MSDCFFHTGRPSVTRCKQCGKALCSECRCVAATGIYCSDKCEQAGAVFTERAQKLDEQRSKGPSAADIAKRIIIILLVLVVIAAVVKKFLR